MGAKFAIWEIIKQHFSTYKKEDDSVSYSDWLLMVIFPLILGGSVCIFSASLSKEAYTNIVTVGAIFTGLLLNLLILVYDQKTKLLELDIKGDDARYKKYALRKCVIDEVHFNISYCIIACLLTVVLSVVASSGFSYLLTIPFIKLKIELFTWLINFPLIFLCIHLVFTILMILKRVNRLISSH